MGTLSIVVGGAILAVAVAWYVFYARGIHLIKDIRVTGPRPLLPGEGWVVYPVKLPEPPQPSPFFVELLSSQNVVVVGCYVVSRQAVIEQVRAQLGEKAHREVRKIAEAFEEEASEVEARLVFTHDMLGTVNRVTAQRQSNAVVISAPVEKVRRVLVPIRGRANMDRIVSFVTRLAQERHVDITYVHIDPDEKTSEGEALLKDARRATLEQGIEPDQCHTRHRVSGQPVDDILDLLEDEKYDLVVIGETEPSVREHVLGDVPSRIASGADRPVIVVEKPD